jgi:hypothetical protein
VAISIRSLAIDPQMPTTLYAGTDETDRSVFKSTDGGGHWGDVSFADEAVPALAVDPQTPTTLYAGAWGVGVYKSLDGGSSWIRPNFYFGVLSLAIDPRTPTTLYAGAYGSGVFKSIDGGGTWSAVNAGLTNLHVSALAIDPLTPITLYASTQGGGVFKSTDSGGSWSAVNTGLTNTSVFALAIDPETPTTVYAGTDGGGVFKSTDGGGSWSALNTGLTNLYVTALAVDPQTPTTIYAGTDGGVFVLEQREPTPNHPPLADAGPDQVVEAADADGALVTLDGSGSSDHDGDSLTFMWSWPSGRATGMRPTVRFPLGSTVVTLTVSDPQAASATDTVQITVRDTTAPTVAVTSPSDGATVSGTITVTASAADAVGVAGVQFLVDGTPLAEDTTAPYEVAWDTKSVPDGTHTLTARAGDTAGNGATSAPVRVTGSNGVLRPTAISTHSEETAAALAPAESWYETTSASSGVKLSGDRAVFAQAAGAAATFTFTGTGVSWIGIPCEICGIATVLIDGTRVATVDTFAPARPAASTAMFASPPLAAGSHTLVIEVTGTANPSSTAAFVVVDAFDATVDGAGLLPTIP